MNLSMSRQVHIKNVNAAGTIGLMLIHMQNMLAFAVDVYQIYLAAAKNAGLPDTKMIYIYIR